MNYEDPILVLTMGRSGSSMLAGILASHGVWTGKCLKPDHRNPKGYFENLRMKKALVEMAGKKITQVYGPDPKWKPLIEAIKKDEGYENGPWLFKHNVIYWKLWLPYMKPKVIFPWRDKKAIFNSVRKSGFHAWQSDDLLWDTIVMHHNEMESVRRHFGGMYIDTELLIDGNKKQLRQAFDYLNISLDESIVDKFIDKSYWHERSE